MARDADLRTDVPRYRVCKDGKLIDEPTDITAYWRGDLVNFLIGCGSTFDRAIAAADVSFRFLGAYKSSPTCIPAGRFHGHMAISASAFKDAHDAVKRFLSESYKFSKTGQLMLQKWIGILHPFLTVFITFY